MYPNALIATTSESSWLYKGFDPMATVRDFFSLVRGPRSRFAPRAPASCEQPARPWRRPSAGETEPVAGVGFAPAKVPDPDPSLLEAAGEELLHAARARGRTPALAVVQIDDLPELEIVFGRSGVDRVMAAVMTGLTRAAAGHGVVVRTAADTFALLMPGGGAGAAIAALQARFGKPCTIEIGFGRDEIFVMPDVMVHPLGPQDSIAQVYEDLRRYIAKARKHGRRIRDCVPERAACAGQAMSLPPAFATPAPAPKYCPPLPATIPMPLGLR